MDYLLDSHTHTIASGHAYNTIYEMAQEAANRGLSLLGITEHTMKMPGTCHELYFMNLKVLPRTLFGIEVMFGAEVNIMDYDGGLDMRQSLLESMDVVVASLHSPCIRPGSREENTRALLRAMENPYVNIIGHPDDGRYPVDYDTLAAAAKERGVLLELNNSSLNPRGSRVNAWENDRELLKFCKQYGTPIILDSDAHCAADVGNHAYSDQLLAELDFPEELVVNRSVELYRSCINRYKSA
ncbi:MAG: phosphatase [Lachnospiraceae bacterium]|nr:phosphatase [Lachnospiraceae bacterium]